MGEFLPGQQPNTFTRRDLLRFAVGAAVGLAILPSCSEADANYNAPIHTTSTSTTVESTTTTTVAVSTTTEAPSTTTTAEPATTTTEAPSWDKEHLLPKDILTEGAKLADLSITNPDGMQLVNVPLFVFTSLGDTNAYDTQLQRGAIVEVAHPEINPGAIGEQKGVPQMGLIGDNGTAVILGHRITPIQPDWDGNQQNGNEGVLQTVFERLDELKSGAVLNLQLVEGAGGQKLTYQLVNLHVIENYSLPGDGVYTNVAYQWRSGPNDAQYLRLMACHPKGEVRDRIAAEFVRVNQTTNLGFDKYS